jgi:hypothetical protein
LSGNPISISPTFERRFYALMSGLALCVVLVGFAKTFYLKGFFGAPSLPLLLHLHGAIMTGWFLLFVVQAALVRARRVDLHRKLGVAGAALACVLIPVALATARQFVIRSFGDSEVLPIAAAIAGYDAVVIAVFAILVAAALSWRRRTDIHKRLMTLAAFSLLGPPLARLVSDEHAVLASNLFVLLPIAIDTVWNRRLHPAFGWGGALVLLSSRAALVMVANPAWTSFVVRLLR